MTLENKYIRVFSCDHIGISGTTNIHTMRQQSSEIGEEIWEARVGIGILGYTNHEQRVQNPFGHKWRDNYVSGFGTIEQKALEALRNNVHQMSQGLF